MSEEKRYLDEQWNDLPLPDGDLAWQKMELLLDKDKKRRVLPFWFWRYAGLGLLLIGLSVGAWVWLDKEKNEKQLGRTTKEEIVNTPASQATPTNETTANQPVPEGDKNQVGAGTPMINEEPSTPSEKAKSSPIPGRTQIQTTQNTNKPIIKRNIQQANHQPAPATTKASKRKTTSLPEDPVTKAGVPSTIVGKEAQPTIVDSSKIASLPVKDTATKKDTVATKTAEPIVSNEPKKDSQTKKTPLVFSAGVGLQQAIAFAEQESSAYNYKGKQNSLSDRIPSVYLRLQKGAWFAQAEFQYAAPQPVEQFFFSRKTRYDAANLNLETEQFTIRKLYYHQLPVSVNYFVLPNLSVGTGAVYSMLAGAVTEQEVTSKNVQTGNESVSRSIAPVQGYKDSFLYKTTAGLLFQTDYHWKRFALGLRYTQNLEPFIKYTRPDGTILNERNRVLQAIIRFRLF